MTKVVNHSGLIHAIYDVERREMLIVFERERVEYIINIGFHHIVDHIKDNLHAYAWWFDQNYCRWEQDNNSELASEMAAHTWKEQWMIEDYLRGLTDKEVAELEKSTLTIARRTA